MKKYSIWQYLIVFLLILFSSYRAYRHTEGKKLFLNEPKILKTSFKEFLKKENISMDINVTNKYETFQTKNLYTNNYFGVAIDFPNNWDADRGVAEHSLIRVFSADSGITMSINAIPIYDNQNSQPNFDIKTLSSEIEGGDLKSYLIKSITENTNRKINNFQLNDKKVGGNNYINYTYNYTDTYDDVEVPMISEVYQTLSFGTTFTISYSAPEFYYNKDKFKNVITNTAFINPVIYDKKY
jgi:hypothetical protein